MNTRLRGFHKLTAIICRLFFCQGEELSVLAILPHATTDHQEPDREIQPSGSPLHQLSHGAGLERGA